MERIELSDADVAYLVGRGGQTRIRLENFSGARMQIDRDAAEVTGDPDERELAKLAISITLQQRNGGSVVHDFVTLEDRQDVSTFDVPKETVGFLLGAKGATLRQMESKHRVFMFFDNDRIRQCKFGPCKRLYVIGQRAAREQVLDEAEDVVRFKLTGESRGKPFDRGGPPTGGGGGGGGGGGQDDRRREGRFDDGRRPPRYDDRPPPPSRYDDRGPPPRDYDDRGYDERRPRYDERGPPPRDYDRYDERGPPQPPPPPPREFERPRYDERGPPPPPRYDERYDDRRPRYDERERERERDHYGERRYADDQRYDDRRPPPPRGDERGRYEERRDPRAQQQAR